MKAAGVQVKERACGLPRPSSADPLFAIRPWLAQHVAPPGSNFSRQFCVTSLALLPPSHTHPCPFSALFFRSRFPPPMPLKFGFHGIASKANVFPKDAVPTSG